MNNLLIVGVVAAALATGASAQTKPGSANSSSAGSGTTNGAMQSDSTGTIGTMHSSSTDPAMGGSAPAPGTSSDGMTMADGKYMMNGKPATKAQIAKHNKSMMTPPK